ncbi:MAG: 4-hydroxybenzoate transporter, partial [Phenylobacterium sp.]|nr:4-hydroxybenzoate transporter [Phenylobacterium sp.]
VFLSAVTAAGFAIRGVQFALNGVVAALYPTGVRGAAMALYMSIARVGAVLGPLLAGWMLAGESQPSLVFRVAAVPALISCIALALLAKPAPRTAAQSAPVH